MDRVNFYEKGMESNQRNKTLRILTRSSIRRTTTPSVRLMIRKRSNVLTSRRTVRNIGGGREISGW